MSYDVDCCPVCDSDALTRRAALTSSFLADYLFGGKSELCSIAQCRNCGLTFFTRRLDAAETARLYAGYRGEEYFRKRHRHEFWYTRRYNSGLGGEGDIASRRQHLIAALVRHRDLVSIGSVLDYGGDRGQILADGPGRQRYVFDLSGAQPVHGVRGLRSEAEFDGLQVDLLVLCEVLEHTSAPVELLRKLAKHLQPGGLLFLTVPDEAVSLARIPAAGWYQRYLRRLARSGILLRLCDFYSTAFRLKLRRIPPFGFAKMHEHLNFFGIASVRQALERAGLEVLECVVAAGGGPIAALAQRPYGQS